MELISREEAIKTARLMIGLTADERENEIRAIPTVEERKEGHWIGMDEEDPRYDYYKCSNCGNEISVDYKRVCDIGFVIEDFNFCPNCGARMKGE